MTKTETVLRSIFGSCRSDIRPLAYAVDIAIELMFVQGIPMDDILVTNDIYPTWQNGSGRSPAHTVGQVRLPAD